MNLFDLFVGFIEFARAIEFVCFVEFIRSAGSVVIAYVGSLSWLTENGLFIN
jgi:hypothetical protein